MNQAAPQPLPEPGEHRCFSGSPWCSGCEPCGDCAEKVETDVLPFGIVAAGQGGAHLHLIHVFAGALADLGVDPEQLALKECGVSLESVFETPEDQVLAFRSGYQEGFGRLVHAIHADPATAALVRVTQVGPGASSMGVPVAAPEQAPEAQPAPVVAAAPPLPPNSVQGDPLKAHLAFMQEQQRLAALRAGQTVPAPIEAPPVAEAGPPLAISPPSSSVPVTVSRQETGDRGPGTGPPSFPGRSPVQEAELAEDVQEVRRILTAADIAGTGRFAPAAPTVENGVNPIIEHL